MTTTKSNQLQVPAGAISVGKWESEKVRPFYCTTRKVETQNGTIVIEMEGEQYVDGTVRRIIYVTECPTVYMLNGHEAHKEGPATGPMAVEDAREFGAALIAAADEQAEWAKHDDVGTG